MHVVLYHIWRERYQIKGYKAATAAIYGLAGLRIVLCMMPQNAWLSADSPLSWGIPKYSVCTDGINYHSFIL